MHDDHCLMIMDARDLRPDRARQVEAAAFPVSGKVLRTAADRAILLDQPRTSNADYRCQSQSLKLALLHKLQQHAAEARNGVISLELVLVAVAPQLHGV